MVRLLVFDFHDAAAEGFKDGLYERVLLGGVDLLGLEPRRRGGVRLLRLFATAPLLRPLRHRTTRCDRRWGRRFSADAERHADAFAERLGHYAADEFLLAVAVEALYQHLEVRVDLDDGTAF